MKIETKEGEEDALIVIVTAMMIENLKGAVAKVCGVCVMCVMSVKSVEGRLSVKSVEGRLYQLQIDRDNFQNTC